MSGPISRPVTIASVPSTGLVVDVVADEAERESLAAANDVQSVQSFAARIELKPFGREGLAARGSLTAEATRVCVVSLEPFTERVEEEIDIRFAPEEPGGADEGSSEDQPDPLVGGNVDLGAVAAEFFTLGLSPHPRKPGAELSSEGSGGENLSPFAALRSLRDNDG